MKPIIDQIKELSELEFVALFEEIHGHIVKQKWIHISEEYCECKEEIEELTTELASSDNDNDFYRNEVRELKIEIEILKERIYTAKATLSDT